MRLRELKVGCLGGGTGLPSLLGGLKRNPWIRADAVVTMFDSGGSSGVLRDELGVLPPGDILKCALALARNAREARRVLLARLPTLEHARLGGHTGGNLLLSMMQRYSGDFLDAIDGLRALLGCRGLGVRPDLREVPAFAAFLLSFSFLYTVLPLAFWGHTPGMAWAGITSHNTPQNGEPLTFDQTVRRWLGAILTSALAGLPLLLAFGGRTLTDWFSGSATYALDDEDEAA